MTSSAVYPVQVLREHLTGLEAAISVCLADPGHKPVHKLRTETRRVEALLLMLALLPDLPEHRKEASALLRALSKLRRAAGEVRDLDVHREMLASLTETENGTKEPAPATPAPKESSAQKTSHGKSNGNAPADASTTAQQISKFATELRKHMGKDRDKAASSLQDLLKTRQAKTAKAAEALLKALDTAKDLQVPAPELLRDAEAVLTRDGQLKTANLETLDEDDLHSIRKAAKAARYVAEALPEDRALADAASRFEALQNAGGQWHDALQLARAARRYFGKGNELTSLYRKERDRKLETYRAALNTTAPKSAAKRGKVARKPAPKRKVSA